MAVVLPYFSKNGRGSRSCWGGCLEPWRPPTRLHSFHYFCPGRGAIYLLLLHHFFLSSYEFNWKVVGKVPLLFDGGVRRGTDVQGVSPRLEGRLSTAFQQRNGKRGVRRRVIEMLKDEFELIMALSGCLVSRILPGAM
ncbi:hypothetical protein D8674_019017 [Pyrus ussuriensis x Pyrus communis]|uniref:FMN-dependent dehydrogenase domain-containing protein n=1 Tax=Pyrus ussuriensis x Pyrus communis TaxID=2448454 RepID=A0A5N5G6E0_9ROSA|nr:hypothetical protein D8674_019017 [Pyrus ussuriensis x Pyrus communis]